MNIRNIFKLICIMICMAVFLNSCTKKDDEKTTENNIVGTKWITTVQTIYQPYEYLVLEFYSENSVQGYKATGDNLVISGETADGTYSISDNNIVFSNLYIDNPGGRYKVETGNLRGTILVTQGQCKLYGDSDFNSWECTWSKVN